MFGAIMAGVGAGAGIAGSIINRSEGNKAANEAYFQQQKAAEEANKLQREMYEHAKTNLEPWRAGGVKALAGMQDADFSRDFTANDFQKDPGYDFRMQEGMKALDRSAAARGSLQSGATLKALSRYNQDFAANEYNNAYNRFNADRDRRFGRLSSLAGMGQNAVNTTIGAGTNYANAVGGNLMSLGNAGAANRLAIGQNNQDMWNGISSSVGGLAGRIPIK